MTAQLMDRTETTFTSAPDRRSRTLFVLFAGVVVVVGVAGYFILDQGTVGGVGTLAVELRDRGRIAVVGGDDLTSLSAEGAQLIAAAEVPGLTQALAGTDEERLVEVLSEAGIGAVLADGRHAAPDVDDDASIEARLLAYRNVESLRGVYLSPTAALYERRRGLRLTEEHGEIVARAARQIMSGSVLPRTRAFPEPIRRTQNVEVMVMLEENGQARLWRSARGGSIARALITASSVARQRWSERVQVLGGPIDEKLPHMTVRVFLLEEDGTLAQRSPAFIERVFTPSHGVAFEHRQSWHYLLPRATQERGQGSAVRAYESLFSDAGLPEDSLSTRDVRVYRLVARELGSSAPDPSRAPLPSFVPSMGSLPEGVDELFGPGELDNL